jgi:hypothetical protein
MFYCYFYLDESLLRYIVQQQIKDLMLRNNDKNNMIESLKNYTINVYGHILSFFKNLKHLSIDAKTLDDCLYLLDGRLKQLTTFIFQIYPINCLQHDELK